MTVAASRQPNPLKEREVEEAAMPGQTACAHALPNVLWQLTLEILPAAASVTAIIVRQNQEDSRFRWNHSAVERCAEQQKIFSDV